MPLAWIHYLAHLRVLPDGRWSRANMIRRERSGVLVSKAFGCKAVPRIPPDLVW